MDRIKRNGNKVPSKKELRSWIINNENFQNENQWMLEYNYDLRDEAMNDLLKNISSNIAKGKSFDMNFKSVKQERSQGWSLSVLSKYWNQSKGFYSNIFSSRKMKASQPLPKTLDYSSRLLKTATGKYYFVFPLAKKPIVEKEQDGSMIFIDPGCRDFITGYDPEGKVIIWGQNDISRIARLLHYKNKLISRKNKKGINAKKRNSLRKAILKENEKIKDLITDLHRKLAKWLCENYSTICIPRLNFHKCKNLNKKSKEKLATFRHCEFLETLKMKSKEYTNTKVYEVNESFTSKTCSDCGFIKHDLGSSKVFKCDSCHVILDRDINAAKNIMLRYFTLRAILFFEIALRPSSLLSDLNSYELEILISILDSSELRKNDDSVFVHKE